MNGHVTIEINGEPYSGDYTVNGDMVQVTLNGTSREADIKHARLLPVTRRLLRELVLAERHRVE
jgi:hypothetical protein